MLPLILSLWYNCADNISVLKPKAPFRSSLELHRDNSAFVHLSTEAGASADCLGVEIVPVRQIVISRLRHGTNTECIIVVVFRKAESFSVVLCPPARRTLHVTEHGKKRCFGIAAVGRYPGTVAVTNASDLAAQDLLDALLSGLVELRASGNGKEPLLRGQVTLCLITAMARQGGVFYAVTATFGLGYDMLPL